MARKIIRPLDRPATGISGPVSARPQRVAVYVRVSSEEQLEGYSLDAQLRAARQYCTDKGWTIAAEYVEEGKSARYEDLSRRPRFQAMLAEAEARAFDVLLVHKLDRFARNLRVTLATLERLDRCGVGFVSLSEQMDFTTPIGKVILATLGAFAQYYSDNLSNETKKGKNERKAQGIHNGLLPFGTVADPDGLAVADERAVDAGGRTTSNLEGLRLAFRLAGEGISDRLVAQALTAAGYRTTGNRGANPFTKDTVAEILTNRFYWGDLPLFEEVRAEDGQLRGRRPLLAVGPAHRHENGAVAVVGERGVGRHRGALAVRPALARDPAVDRVEQRARYVVGGDGGQAVAEDVADRRERPLRPGRRRRATPGEPLEVLDRAGDQGGRVGARRRDVRVALGRGRQQRRQRALDRRDHGGADDARRPERLLEAPAPRLGRVAVRGLVRADVIGRADQPVRDRRLGDPPLLVDVGQECAEPADELRLLLERCGAVGRGLPVGRGDAEGAHDPLGDRREGAGGAEDLLPGPDVARRHADHPFG